MIRHLHISELEYPEDLRALKKDAPEVISVEGDFRPAPLHVAIVGARDAIAPVRSLAKRLARGVVAAGGVVVSGGAVGVDTAAHLGALAAGGRTWAVLGCGAPYVTRHDDAKFFDKLQRSRRATLVRPFAEGTKAHTTTFPRRNGVLVALSQIVVVVQAAMKSGSLNSARWAHDLERELWVVPGFAGPEFEGSWWALDHYEARILRREGDFFERLRQPPPSVDGDALTLFKALERGPKHPDELAHETGLSTPAVTTALLTLALGDVVVEGSAGLFSRKKLVTG